jgi:hypothetical protein
MSNKTTTEVDEAELLKKYLPTYINAPEDLEQARDRILEIEMALEDLARAVEIAQITNNWSMLDSFRQTTETVLQGKIEIVQPDQSDMKLNVVIDDRKDKADA